MEKSSKPDIAKIVIVGIPILLLIWTAVFIILAVLTRDIVISKYGGLLFFIISIPAYGFLAKKYANRLGATISTDEQEVRNKNIYTKNPKRYVTKLDLWIVGSFLVVFPVYLIVGQFVFGLENDLLIRYAMMAIPLILVVELTIRYRLKSRTTKDNTNESANKSLE